MTTRLYFCDMDGVVADFHAGASEFFRMNARKNQAEFTAILESPAGWPRLKREWPTFWSDLPLMPHALDLWSVLQPYHPSMLTAIPPSWPSAGTGKTIWVKRNLPKFGYHPTQRVYAVQRHEKVKFARQSDGTPNVLIDDFGKNIREWQAAGGIGIKYEDSASAVNHVKTILKSL